MILPSTICYTNAMHRSVTSRLHLTNKQQWQKLLLTCRACRFVYNEVLRQVGDEYQNGAKPNLSHFAFNKERLTPLRNNATTTWLQQVAANPMQAEMSFLAQAFKDFFRRSKAGEKPGYPKFKSLWRDRQSFTVQFNQQQVWLKGNKLKVPKVGWLRMSKHEPLGKPCRATVYLDAGKWYVSVLYEVADSAVSDTGVMVGLDRNVGQVTLSDGSCYALPVNERLQRRCKHHERALARKRRAAQKRQVPFWSGRRYQRKLVQVQKCQRQQRNIRKNWAHQTSAAIAAKASRVAVEG